MAVWTEIADTRLEPGKPIRSIDGLALRDNPIAIAEGAAGAPRIHTAAFASSVAGTMVVGRLQNAGASASRPSSAGSGTSAASSVSTHFSVLVPGTVRVTYTASIAVSATGSSRGSGYVSVLKNGVAVSTLSSSGTTSVDISVMAGDSLAVSASATVTTVDSIFSASASASSSNVLVQNSSGDLVGV